MKPYLITLINAIILVIIGLWGYLGSDSPSFTALIPVASGIVLLALSAGMNKANRIISHIVVVLTLVILIAFIKPLTGALERNDNAAVARVLLMMLSCSIALIAYIRSFIVARRQRG